MDMNISYINTNRSFPLPEGEGVSGTAVGQTRLMNVYYIRSIVAVN
jgi:hypothetical protein